MTLNGVMAIICCIISANLVAFGPHCVKVVEDIPNLSVTNVAQSFKFLEMYHLQ